MAYVLKDQHGRFLRITKDFGVPNVETADVVAGVKPTLYKDTREALNAVGDIVDVVNAEREKYREQAENMELYVPEEHLEKIEVEMVEYHGMENEND